MKIKYQIGFFLVLLIVFNSAQAQGVIDTGVNEIKCELSLKKKKAVFKKGKYIDFIGTCSNETGELTFMPRRFIEGSANFRPNIVFENEAGVKYRFLHYQYAYKPGDLMFVAVLNGAELFNFRFPDEKGRYRIVEKDAWDDTKDHQIEKRQDIIKNSLAEIPPGKYKAWLDMRHQWQTVKVGNTFMVLENYNNYDNRADVFSWEIKDVSPAIEFEIK